MKIIANAILAGVLISIGSYAYLKNPGPIGAVLCSVGFAAVFYYRLLFCTTAMYKADTVSKFVLTAAAIALNIVGCKIVSLVTNDDEIIKQCESIVMQRAELGLWETTLRGIGCGLIVTMAAQSWKSHWWTLLIGVPAFILAGFTHCLSDAFYYYVGCNGVFNSEAFIALCWTTLGNFIGCNLHKLGAVPMESE